MEYIFIVSYIFKTSHTFDWFIQIFTTVKEENAPPSRSIFFRHLDFLHFGNILSKLVQHQELSELFEKYGHNIIINVIL